MQKQKHKTNGLHTTYKLAWTGFLFTLPFLVLFLIFTVLPVVQSAAISLTDYNMMEPGNWIGFENYFNLFTNDDVFLTALTNTLLFALVIGPMGLIMAFVFAYVISQLKCKTGFSLAFYAPSITSSIALSSIWLYFFSPDRYGFFNNVLISMGIIDSPILWTTDPSYVFATVVFISLWMSMGTGFLTFLAGIQNVSPELYEAGMIDGVRNKFQQLIYITLPNMKPQLLFGVINAVASAFGTFDIPVAVAGIPSPNYSAHTLVAHLYDHAFLQFEMGYASSIAIVLFVLTYSVGSIFRKILTDND